MMGDSHLTEVERDRRREERKREKELAKALETPEQKRARRLAKKEDKEIRRKRLMGWDEEYMGYTNEDNPFGDSNLHGTFVWQKKYEKLGLKDVNEEEISQINKRKMIKNKQELEKVKQRRLEREREREARMEEMSRMQRDREAEQFKEWAKQEDYFHLKQARLRSKLRIKEGRAKPIDLLARYINVFGDTQLPSEQTESEQSDSNVEAVAARSRRRIDQDEEELTDRIQVLQQSNLQEPYNYLNGLRTRDMEDLIVDIRVYMELDCGSEVNANYWRDLQIIVEDELAKLKLASMDMQERRREGINPSVSADIAKILKGKTPAQLQTLQSQVEKKISSKEEGIDIGYWETLLSRLRAHIARARLRELHEKNLGQRNELIKKFQQQLQELRPSGKAVITGSIVSGDDLDLDSNSKITEHDPTLAMVAANTENEDELRFLSAVELEQKCIQDYRNGGYSPKLISIDEVPTGALVLNFADRERELDELRTTTIRKLIAFPIPFVQFGNQTAKETNYDHNSRSLNREEEAFVREARKGMHEDEAIFSVEEELLDSQQIGAGTSLLPIAAASGSILVKDKYSWAEKYRPRKPRYFNRVHTGFEWNKYNQTHYDVDNPPPKVVQGYKFNIFYPDLIDKHTTPSYKITPCPENKDFAYIRFTAGPPYEDICFKIVNREWNYSYKSGFRCQFQNNILQLWFHFKRYRYRR